MSKIPNGHRPDQVVNEYESLLQHAKDHALTYLKGVSQRPVKSLANDEELRDALGGPLPEGPSDPTEVLDALVAGVDRGLVPTGHGRYFGYVVGGTLPIAMAADWLTSTWDQNCIVHDISPATSVVEEICSSWLVELFGLPMNTSVAFVPACTHAELLCLAAARHKVLADRGWNVAEQGLQGGPEVVVLVNDSTHTAVIRSLQILGLGGGIRPLATDAQSRILPDALDAALRDAAGTPLIVCGQVGEINTGGVDYLDALCDKVHAVGGWVHLDAAFGMWAAASPSLRHTLVAGIEDADSWATDAHKWLNTPYDGGIAMIAHPDIHRAAIPLSAQYLNLQDKQRHPVEWGIEVSRRSRAFPIWATLRCLGRAGIAEIVDRCCTHARRLAHLISVDDSIHVVNEVMLNQVLVCLEHPEGDHDSHTRQVATLFQDKGAGWATVSRWRDRVVLRLSLTNWATTTNDIDVAARSLIECHRSLLGQRQKIRKTSSIN